MPKFVTFDFVVGCIAVFMALLEPHYNTDGLLIFIAGLQFYMWAKDQGYA